MGQEYCKAKKDMCDPRDCRVENCWWRDTVWVLKQMPGWAYSTDYEKPKPSNSPSENTNQEKDEES